MKQKIDDLEVSLIAYDKGKRAYDSFSKGMFKAGDAAEFLATTLRSSVAAGAVAATAAFTKLVIDGKEVSLSVREMGREIGATTREADALYSVIRETNPSASVEDLSDAVLTLSERFTEGRVNSGELFNFVKDFGLEANFAVEGARAQTVEFLRILKQLPSETDRVSTAIAVMGDSGARQFNKMLRDVNEIDNAMEMWSGSVDNIAGVMSQEDSDQLDEYADSVAKLSKAYDELSESAFMLIVDDLTAFNRALASVIKEIDFFMNQGSGFLDETTENWKDNLKQAAGFVREIAPDGLFDKIPDWLTDAIDNSYGGDPIAGAIRMMQTQPEYIAPTQNPHGPVVNLPKITKPVELPIDEEKYLREMERLERERMDMLRDIAQERFRFEQNNIEDQDPIFQNPLVRNNLDAAKSDFERNQQQAIEDSEAMAEAAAAQAQELSTLAQGYDVLGNAIGGFSDMAVSKGSKAFKIFQGLQFAAASASAYSAATQVLADFKTFTYGEKVLAAGKVLSLGLGWAKKIKAIKASGESASGASVESVSTPSGVPQAQRIDFDEGANGDVININVQGEKVTVSDLQEMARRISEIPNQPFVTVTGN